MNRMVADDPSIGCVLIGGVSRAGKSILAERLSQCLGRSYFSLDVMMDGIKRAIETNPDLAKATAEQITLAAIPGLVENLLWLRTPYILEGYLIRPHFVAGYSAGEEPRQVRSIFLGYPNCDVEQKVQEIRRSDRPNWLHHRSDDFIRRFVAEQKEVSRDQESACARLGIRFVDMSFDFQNSLERAVEAVLGRP